MHMSNPQKRRMMMEKAMSSPVYRRGKINQKLSKGPRRTLSEVLETL
jgi:hypothetical protein